MEISYLLDVLFKGSVTSVISGIILRIFINGYYKLKTDRNSDVFEDALSYFLFFFMIYLVFSVFNHSLLHLIQNKYESAKYISYVTYFTITLSYVMSIVIPISFAKIVIFLRNKFYLIKKGNEPCYRLLMYGTNILESKGFEFNNSISKVFFSRNDNIKYYNREEKLYFDKNLKEYIFEVVYTHKYLLKRFLKIVPKRWIFLFFLPPLFCLLMLVITYIIEINIVLSWFIIGSIMFSYLADFMIIVHISTYILRENKQDQHEGYYRNNKQLV